MTYQEAEQFFYSLMNIPREEYLECAKKGGNFLVRTQFFLDIIGNPEKKIPHYIHVTGTSGKGSVCTYLHYILKEAGLKSGLCISPHPGKLVERWQINGRPMSEKEFTDIIYHFKSKLDEYMRTSPYDMLSLFELDTAIALYFFAQKKVEWAVIEVGLGGRYDSTNVIPHKDIAVITNIGLDHTEILGNSKEKIAYEKAGIIRPECAVFTSESNNKILEVIKKECEKNRVKVFNSNTKNEPGKTEKIIINDRGLNGVDFIVNNEKYRLNTIGIHQVSNAKLAIDVANHIGIQVSTIKKGLKNAKQPLRMEAVSEDPLIILDGAHNPDKMKTTVEAIKRLKNNNNSAMKQFNNVHIIVGFSEDKNIKSMINLLASLDPVFVACTRNTDNLFRRIAVPRGIKKIFLEYPTDIKKIELFIDPIDALKWVKSKTKKDDIILVTGSIFLSGEIRKKISSRLV